MFLPIFYRNQEIPDFCVLAKSTNFYYCNISFNIIPSLARFGYELDNEVEDSLPDFGKRMWFFDRLIKKTESALII